jgi:hypothetical protein
MHTRLLSGESEAPRAARRRERRDGARRRPVNGRPVLSGWLERTWVSLFRGPWPAAAPGCGRPKSATAEEGAPCMWGGGARRRRGPPAGRLLHACVLIPIPYRPGPAGSPGPGEVVGARRTAWRPVTGGRSPCSFIRSPRLFSHGPAAFARRRSGGDRSKFSSIPRRRLDWPDGPPQWEEEPGEPSRTHFSH